MKKPSKKSGKTAVRRAPLEPLLIGGEIFPLYKESLQPVTVDTRCRVCDQRVYIGTAAFFRKGEMHCAHHWSGRQVPGYLRFYSKAAWRGDCATCQEPIKRGVPMFWRSCTVCLVCAYGHRVERGPAPETARFMYGKAARLLQRVAGCDEEMAAWAQGWSDLYGRGD